MCSGFVAAGMMRCLGGAVFANDRVGLAEVSMIVGWFDLWAACKVGAAFLMESMSGDSVVMS
jgi:hypothetical protein